MGEIWADIPGWEGKYQVSNKGRVKSLRYRNSKEEKIMTIQAKANGYLFVGFRKPGCKRKFQYHVHRLVAEAFIPNPNNLPQVNHKDEDRTNNVVENLEWCDAAYNLSYGTRHEREIKTQQETHPSMKPVDMFTLNGEFIKQFKSAREAERETGIFASSIGKCCLGQLETSGGHKWRFAI